MIGATLQVLAAGALGVGAGMECPETADIVEKVAAARIGHQIG
jgi:hypothetical protein